MNDFSQTTHEHSTFDEVASELGTSGLVYLFADKLVSSDFDRTLRTSIKVPCRHDMIVPQAQLAALLFATAFWGLREQGYITLQLDRTMRIRVRAIEQGQGQHQGLEGMIMANLLTKKEPHVASIIYNCWQDNTTNPWNDVVQVVAQTVTIISNDCGKLTILADAFNDIARRWQQFQATELVLYKALIDDCVQGIAARAPDAPMGNGKHTSKGSGINMSDVLVAGAVGAGLVLANSDGSSDGNIGTESNTDSRGFFDFVGDFFSGLGDFMGDFFSGLGDFMGDFMGDSDGGFDFD